MVDHPNPGLEDDRVSQPLSEPQGDKKDSDRKKGKKKKKKLKDATSQHKQAHHADLAEDLARIQVTLQRLRTHLGDLDSAQRVQLERAATFDLRLDAVAKRVSQQVGQLAVDRQCADDTATRLNTAANAIQELRSEADAITGALTDLAAHADDDTAVFSIERRLGDAERRLGDLSSALAEVRARADKDAALQALRERVGALEEGLQAEAGTLRAPKRASEPARELFAVFGHALQRHIDALAEDVRSERKQANESRSAQLGWIERRLSTWGRNVAIGLALVLLLFAAVLTSHWWQMKQRLDLTQARLAELEQTWRRPETGALGDGSGSDPLRMVLGQLTQTLERMDARSALLANRLTPVSATPEDVLARLRRLEDRQDQLQHASGASARAAVGFAPEPDGAAEERGRERIGPVAVAKDVGEADPRVPGSVSAGDIKPAQGGTAAEKGHAASSPQVPSSSRSPIVLDQERYVIQLIGFRQESSVSDFARRFGIADEAWYMRSRFQGRDWYVVLLGDFPDREAGRAVAERLPPELQALDPWVRPLKAGSRLLPIE
jgi:hypothetical protein